MPRKSSQSQKSYDVIVVPLPSLIHRIGREQANELKRMAQSFRCSVGRVRRSRNWQLSGEAEQLTQLVASLKETDIEAWSFVLSKSEAVLSQIKPKETQEDKLARLLRQDPNITLGALMEQTNCSQTEARKARFAAEDW